MGDIIEVSVHEDHKGQEIRNVGGELMTTAQRDALTGADLFEGRIIANTSTGHRNHYAGGVWTEIANTSDLNKFGSLIPGPYNASGGIPTTGGSGIDAEGVPLVGTASIQAGDYWFVTTLGTISGIEGDDVLAVGDFLWALQDNPTLPAHFAGVNMNVNEELLGTALTATLSTPLVAATPLSFAAVMTSAGITTAKTVVVSNNATGNDILISINKVAKTVESNIAYAGVTIEITGIA